MPTKEIQHQYKATAREALGYAHCVNVLAGEERGDIEAAADHLMRLGVGVRKYAERGKRDPGFRLLQEPGMRFFMYGAQRFLQDLGNVTEKHPFLSLGEIFSRTATGGEKEYCSQLYQMFRRTAGHTMVSLRKPETRPVPRALTSVQAS